MPHFALDRKKVRDYTQIATAEAWMAEYRFYLLDERQVTLTIREMELANDTAAMEEASTLRAVCHVVEIWHGQRMVARILGPAA